MNQNPEPKNGKFKSIKGLEEKLGTKYIYGARPMKNVSISLQN